MFGLGMGEIVVILIVALLVLGPEKLPDAAKQIGKTIRDLRRHTRDLQETIEKDEHIGGTVRDLKSALRGDELSPFRTDDILPPSRFKPPEIEAPVPQAAPEATAEAAPEGKAEPAAPAAAPAPAATPDESRDAHNVKT